jgi:PAS domain S-box-containing protein
MSGAVLNPSDGAVADAPVDGEATIRVMAFGGSDWKYSPVPVTENGDPEEWNADTGLLEALSLAAVAVDVDGRVRHSNQAAQSFFGTTGDQLSGKSVAAVLFAEQERGPVEEILSQALAGRRWSGEMPVVGREGVVRPVTLSMAPVIQGDRIVGALLIAEDVSGTNGRARRLADRLTRLARVTAELVFADNLETVTKIVIEHMADAAGATVASLSVLVDHDTLALVGLRGGREGAASRWATYSVDADAPASEAFRTGQTLVLTDRDEIRQKFPQLESAAEGERSMVCLPLQVAARRIGVMTMTFPGRRAFEPAELEFFRILADTCAQAVDRMRALEDAADQASKLQFLADASAELASSLDYEATLRSVARLAVPGFADWCAISLEQDGVLRTLAVAHVDPAKVALAEELERRYPADPESDQGAYQVLRTGQSELTPEITDEMIFAAVGDGEQLDLIRQLNFRSALSVPLRAKDRVFGVMSWVTGEQGRRFGPSDLAFGEDLARRAAVAIDNSQLHSEMREVAIRLQEAILPAALPVEPGWDMAALYLQAGHADAGGDFYDVIPLDEGRLAFFVGDVMGRGVKAAAAMAQMRSAVRTLVAVEPEPDIVLARLDLLFSRFDLEELVTVVYAVADPARDELVVANAGHLPPVILRSDGTVEELDSPGGLLLGAGGSERATLTIAFHVGDTLLAFTDGLIERRTEDISTGQQRLVDACPLLVQQDLPAALIELVDAVRDPTSDDDVAALAVRRKATD